MRHDWLLLLSASPAGNLKGRRYYEFILMVALSWVTMKTIRLKENGCQGLSFRGDVVPSVTAHRICSPDVSTTTALLRVTAMNSDFDEIDQSLALLNVRRSDSPS
jgi:hypothetical protein